MAFLQQFFGVFAHNLLPMFLLIGTGALLQRRFRLDIRSLNRLNIYAFVPGLLFAKLLEADIELGTAGSVLATYVVSIGLLLLLGHGVCRGLGGKEKARASVSMCSAFANTGNYGIPLMALVFGPEGVVYQSIVLMGNNVLMYTLGLFVVAHRASWRRTVTSILSVPIVYAMLGAVAVRSTGVALPQPLLVYVRYLGDGLVPVALLTLGAQLVESRLGRDRRLLVAGTVLRLLAGPAVTTVVVLGMAACGGLTWGGMAAGVLILGAGAPAAINNVIITTEFESREDLAAGIVLASTLLSAFTVPILLLLLRT